MNKISLQDCLNIGSPVSNKSLFVIIDASRHSWGLDLAQAGGYLEYQGDSFYKCNRIVADNLSLNIISDFPLTIK